MIVDCHTHINFDDSGIGISEHRTASETVDVSIVLANPKNNDNQTNTKLAEYVNSCSEKTVGFAFIDPVADKVDTESLANITKKIGLKGIVLYCSQCGFHPANTKAIQLYEAAQELGLPVFFHNASHLSAEAVLDYTQPYLLDEVARTFKDLKIVIGTMGVPFIKQTLMMVAKHKNVYANLTIKPDSVWQVYNIVVAANEYGVMNKLLFGSGFPLANAQQCIETLLGFNKLLVNTNLPTVPRGNIRNIIERNTLELLGIKD